MEADRLHWKKPARNWIWPKLNWKCSVSIPEKAKVNDLNASILTAEAKLESARNSFELEKTQELEIEEQIEKCMIFRPTGK